MAKVQFENSSGRENWVTWAKRHHLDISRSKHTFLILYLFMRAFGNWRTRTRMRTRRCKSIITGTCAKCHRSHPVRFLCCAVISCQTLTFSAFNWSRVTAEGNREVRVSKEVSQLLEEQATIHQDTHWRIHHVSFNNCAAFH